MRKQVRLKYILATVVAVSLLLFNQAFIQYWLNQKQDDAKKINMAGRQRMLSQKLNLELYRHIHSDGSIKEVNNTWEAWNKAHYQLLNGDEELGIEPAVNESVILALNGVEHFIAQAKEIVERDNITDKDINELYANQIQFLAGMEGVVGLLEHISNDKLRYIVTTEIILALLSIAVIIFEVLYIFKPISVRLMNQLLEMRRKDDTLRGISENSIEAITVMDTNFNIVYTNKVAQTMYAHIQGSKSPQIGDNCKDFPLGNEPLFTESYQSVMQGNVEQFEYENDGSTYLFLAFPHVTEGDSSIKGIVTIAQDISTMKEQEAKIKDQMNRFREIAWEQSHEVRRPLTNVLLCASLLKETQSEELNDEAKQYIEFINKEARTLDDIVRKIVEKTEEIPGLSPDYQIKPKEYLD